MIIRPMTSVESALFDSVEILQKRIAELHQENERDRNELKAEINSLNIKLAQTARTRDYFKNRANVLSSQRYRDYW